jgi:hypothetical protein
MASVHKLYNMAMTDACSIQDSSIFITFEAL